MQSNSHNGCMSSLLASWPLALSSALASPWSFTQVLHLLPSLAMGAALGFFGGVFGIGGGIIAIPALVLLGGMEQAQAQGTALVMMVPNLLIGWWRYSLKNPAPRSRVFGIGLLASLTTGVVAHFAHGLHPDTLRSVFSVCLLLIALRMLQQMRALPATPTEDKSPKLSPRWIPLVGVVGGSSMGLLGIGGGLVATPLLTAWFGQRQAMAQSLSLALVAPSSVIALGTYASAGQVDWALGLPMALSGMFTVSSGVALATRLPEKKMRSLFAWMLATTSVWLLVWPHLR
jgi:uncharacterized membrane protein YfcA